MELAGHSDVVYVSNTNTRYSNFISQYIVNILFNKFIWLRNHWNGKFIDKSTYLSVFI